MLSLTCSRTWPVKMLTVEMTQCEVKLLRVCVCCSYCCGYVCSSAEQNTTELSCACLELYALPKESPPAYAVRSAPTRGDTLDKLNSDKSACQYDLNHGRYILSTLCHISAPAGLTWSAMWL